MGRRGQEVNNLDFTHDTLWRETDKVLRGSKRRKSLQDPDPGYWKAKRVPQAQGPGPSIDPTHARLASSEPPQGEELSQQIGEAPSSSLKKTAIQGFKEGQGDVSIPHVTGSPLAYRGSSHRGRDPSQERNPGPFVRELSMSTSPSQQSSSGELSSQEESRGRHVRTTQATPSYGRSASQTQQSDVRKRTKESTSSPSAGSGAEGGQHGRPPSKRERK